MFILNLLSQHPGLLAYALLLWALFIAVALAAITGSKKLDSYFFWAYRKGVAA